MLYRYRLFNHILPPPTPGGDAALPPEEFPLTKIFRPISATKCPFKSEKSLQNSPK